VDDPNENDPNDPNITNDPNEIRFVINSCSFDYGCDGSQRRAAARPPSAAVRVVVAKRP
jgi:hypothetical protein